jgi:hypothetical protein
MITFLYVFDGHEFEFELAFISRLESRVDSSSQLQDNAMHLCAV